MVDIFPRLASVSEDLEDDYLGSRWKIDLDSTCGSDPCSKQGHECDLLHVGLRTIDNVLFARDNSAAKGIQFIEGRR